MTEQKTKFHGWITVIPATLLLLGFLYGTSWGTSAVSDLKLNGADDLTTLTTNSSLTVTIQMDAGDQAGETVDWWIAAQTPMGWFYYGYPNGWYLADGGMDSLSPAYQGPLFTMTEPLEVLRITGLQPGSYAFYFGMDTTVNGILDGALSHDRIAFEVVDAAKTGSYPVVDTGQTACYDDSGAISCPGSGESFYGQDAQYSGNQPSYTNNGDGTVTDNVTGLMWQQSPDTNGDGEIDAADKLTFEEAVDEAGAQTTGGYADWRLPTIKELYSLILFSGVDPSGYEGTDTSGLVPFIDDETFDFAYGDTRAGERIIDAQYASSNLYAGNTAGDGGGTLFGVNFADGRIKGYGLSLFGSNKTFFVIYVRGNTGYGQNSFTNNGDGTITDNATNLMWAQNDNGTGLNWEEALAWVETQNAVNYLGHDDWRLPNAKELQSIVDYSRSPDTTGSAAIDPLFNATPITNEAGKIDYPFYWTGTTHANWSQKSGGFGAYVAFGRAMGYMGSWVDVHGAGAQRSDPKAGDPADYPNGNGPQGDAIRIYNYVRLVRTANGAMIAKGF